VLVPALVINWGGVTPFVIWSSLIVLVYGVVHLIGLIVLWRS
jgi:hypothetical protein